MAESQNSEKPVNFLNLRLILVCILDRIGEFMKW